LAQSSIEGQRSLARDAAMREWRKAQVAPFVTYVDNRMVYYSSFYLPMLQQDHAAVRSLNWSPASPEELALMATIGKLGDDRVMAAFEAFSAAETLVPLEPPFQEEAFFGAYRTISKRQADLMREMERYVMEFNR